MALWMFIPHLFTLSVVPEQNEMASGNGTTKLAVWSGWWCVISRKSSAAGTSWSVLTAWWHPTALCASSGKCAVYPQGSQIIGSEELKTGTICQITEHMRLPVSTVSLIQHVSDLKQILQPISAKRPKGVGCGVLYFCIWNLKSSTVQKGLLLHADGWKAESSTWVWSLFCPNWWWACLCPWRGDNVLK